MTDYIKRVQAVVWMRKLIRTENNDKGNTIHTPLSRSGTGLERHLPHTSRSSIADMHATTKTGPIVNGDSNSSLSNEGRLGLVPHTAREGDFIGMLRGCSVPVVVRMLDAREAAGDTETQDQLRKLKDQATGKKWDHVVCRLIGECYVHGIMDGEIFKMREEHNLQDSIFEII